MLAFASFKSVPSSITESTLSFGLVRGCYPTSTIVNMEQDLKQWQISISMNFSIFKEAQSVYIMLLEWIKSQHSAKKDS